MLDSTRFQSCVPAGLTIYIIRSSTSVECLDLHELIMLNNSNSLTGFKNIEFKLLEPIVLKILCGTHGASILPMQYITVLKP